MSRKIAEWEKEIERIRESEKLLREKNAKRIRELQSKIDAEKRLEEQENNKLIATVVREMYGEITAENIDNLKQFFREHGHSVVNV